MFSPEQPHVVVDDGPIGLDYWVSRCTKNSGQPTEFYLRYRDVSVVLHPRRAALVEHEGRQILLENAERYKGKKWEDHLCGDIEQAVDKLLAGDKGDEKEVLLGDLIRIEVARRVELGGPRPVDQREYWFEWLLDDELPLLMGAWVFNSGIVSYGYDIKRKPALGFSLAADDLDAVADAGSPSNMNVVLRRLAKARIGPDREVLNA